MQSGLGFEEKLHDDVYRYGERRCFGKEAPQVPTKKPHHPKSDDENGIEEDGHDNSCNHAEGRN